MASKLLLFISFGWETSGDTGISNLTMRVEHEPRTAGDIEWLESELQKKYRYLGTIKIINWKVMS